MKHEKFKKDQYSELYKYMQKWIDHINPCNISGSDKNMTCVLYPNGNKDNLLCCSATSEKSACAIFNIDCPHHSKNKGCKVQSLSCSLWFCKASWDYMFENNSPKSMKNFIQALQFVSQTIRLHFIPARSRASKKDNFEYAGKVFK